MYKRQREYNGIFAVVFGMIGLEAARTSSLDLPAWNTMAWRVELATSILAFLFLRFLKTRTRVLHVAGREFDS